MTILGIDSSGSACTGAISCEGKIVDSFKIVSKKSHSELLLPEIKALLDRNGLSLDNIDYIAVSCGPGSYTGLRIGISTVKGLAVTRNIKAIPISSLEALCYNASFDEGSVISAMLDARREEFYQAFFKIENGEVKRLTEDRSILFDELFSETEKYGNVFVIGDGTEKFIRLAGKEFKTLSEFDNFANAESIVKLADKKTNSAVEVTKLSPVYLKLSQAEREYIKSEELK